MSRKKTSVRKSDVKGIMRFAKRYPILAVIIAVIVVGVFVFQSVQNNANKVTIPMDGYEKINAAFYHFGGKHEQEKDKRQKK